MNFMEIAQNRQSCRKYDSARCVENEKIEEIVCLDKQEKIRGRPGW